MSASAEPARRRRSAGFTLLEAIVALSIVSTAIAAAFALLNFTLSTTNRLQDTVRRGEAIENAAQFVDRMNPFDTPEGELQFAQYTVKWTSQIQGKPRRNVVVAGVPGPYDVALFEVTVTGVRDQAEWFSFTTRQVGFRRLLDDRGPFQ